MLNLEKIRDAMMHLGLNQIALAKDCDVSKEAVSNWLSGESVPRPNKLKALATALKIDVAQLVAPPQLSEPIAAFRTRRNRPATGDGLEAAQDQGYHFQQLVPFILRETVFAPSVLEKPRLDEEYIREAARQVRVRNGFSPSEPLTRDNLLYLLRDFGALLVPVPWGKERVGHENALSVYLPESKTSWVVFNINAKNDDFNYWLAHELGHCYTLHSLQGDDGEQFAERFAQELLFPLEAAREALSAICSAPSPREQANWYAGKYEISVVTVVKQADRAAEIAEIAPTGLQTKSFWSSWSAARHSVPTVAQVLFGHETLSTSDYVIKCEQEFKTPIFRTLAKWQRQEGGRSPAFIAGALNVELGLAFELSHFLMTLQD
ncbi:helix-turn-helix domain-containing protein [Massilia sp. NEAU-DD11]|uniref:Helix-turn-helix domain-containing protein n=1 Tax=Massilia cellulosiltytica TaxID=2683234 RepID=A0A7X3G644_9BURK|nr:helix-turn-helix domain-containing protein [Telluria cellulosilytica]MVW64328.1 helix-turn-helix domain-containing protein [Telluria cellulosilytica]